MDLFNPKALAAIEASTREVGHYIFDHLSRRGPSPFERRWWDDRIMSWAMQDESVKVQMFRFIDVLPMLRDSRSVTAHLQEYFEDVRAHLPAAVRFGLNMAKPTSLAGRALALAVRRNAAAQARRFIAGVNAEEVLAAAMRQRKLRRAFTLDRLGEAVITESEADEYLRAGTDLIRGMAGAVNAWPEIPQLDRHGPELLPRLNLSIKLSALDSQFDAIDTPGATRRVAARLRTLLRVAREHQAFVNVDMESYATKDLVLHIFRQVMAEEEFRDTSHVGIVIQCYLKDAEADLRALADWAQGRGTPVWVRLVKGAYWDYETVHATANGWPIPVFEHKPHTDANMEQLTRLIFSYRDVLRPAIASHNIRTLSHAIAVARYLGLPPGSFELQMLYGMGDEIKDVVVDMGHRLRVYMPYGELIPGMAYLVRRLLENTSNDSFLRASFTEHVSPEKLLANPLDLPTPDLHEKSPVRVVGAGTFESATPATGQHMQGAEAMGTGSVLADIMQTFRNEPPTDFSKTAARAGFQQALDRVRGEWGKRCSLWIDGRSVESGNTFEARNPSHRRQIIGHVAEGTRERVDAAVAAAKRAFPEWWRAGATVRAEVLRRAADIMRRDRFELAAWIVHECGKPWREADGDVAEAIDFCEYYSAGAVALDSEHGVDVPGEENRFLYLPRGVAAVIAPWNFPLAILTGMSVAALATGNAVIMKPAETSSIIGAKLMEILNEAGTPPGVAQFLPGKGEVVGAGLVEHPDVALIAFTGSREVGLSINRRAAEVSTQSHSQVKRVIAEMGGKNAIVIDADADLDEAVVGVVRSAFGYQGQKCSACSRVIVLDAVYDVFVHRLIEATRSLKVAPAEDPGCDVGPLIDDKARDRVLKYIETGKREAKLALATDIGSLADEGYFVGPHIFIEVSPDAVIAQQEIFGPVLAVLRARDLDEAFAIVNGTEFALTGGIFSRSPRSLDRARREMLVGNLYLNRGITGALVGRQPFGGFKMSGIGSKAGGPDYLLQFVLPRTVTENTMRRGFAPATKEEVD